MQTLIKEPLLHFLAIALVFFVIYNQTSSDVANANTITISDGRISEIENTFTERWKRAPLPEELDAAINGYALNQMYLNEARSMSLDMDDQIVDKRLRQKMNYLLEAMALSQVPSDDELKAYYQDNIGSYMSVNTFDFKQVFISTERNEKELADKIAQQLDRVEKGLEPVGDSSLIPTAFTQSSAAQLQRQFGEGFVSLIDALPAQIWSGPINSSIGQHFVFLESKQSSEPKPYERVENKVLTDWQYQKKKEYQADYEEKLLAKYLIETSATEESR